MNTQYSYLVYILLFTAKPLLRDAARWLLIKYSRTRCTSTSSRNSMADLDNIDHDHDQTQNKKDNTDVERFVTLCKQSKVKWQKHHVQHQSEW